MSWAADLFVLQGAEAGVDAGKYFPYTKGEI